MPTRWPARKRGVTLPLPTIAHLREARSVFQTNETRDLFYRAATTLVEQAIDEEIPLSVGESVAVLLQTWNRVYYQYNRFTSEHLARVEELMSSNLELLSAYRTREILSLSGAEEEELVRFVAPFAAELGPVGAAKALHLLAPGFFPLLDRKIAEKGYGYPLHGAFGPRYVLVMRDTKTQVLHLGEIPADLVNPLKAIDEYNYSRFTKGWLN